MKWITALENRGSRVPDRMEATERAMESGSAIFEFRKEWKTGAGLDILKVALGIFLLVSVWQVTAETVNMWKGLAIFPTPAGAIERLYNLLTGEMLYNDTIFAHLGASLTRWVLGYLLAVLTGIALGIVLGVSRHFHDVGIVPVYILQMIPGLAWVPIALIIFGLGDVSTIFMIFMTALPPIVINTSGGIRSVSPDMVRAAEMMGASRSRIFFRILIPASALSLINGLRIGLANGWRVLIAAEMVVGVALGLGYSIIQSRWSLDFEAAFVCIIIICTIGLVIEKFLFTVLENRIRNRLGLVG